VAYWETGPNATRAKCDRPKKEVVQKKANATPEKVNMHPIKKNATPLKIDHFCAFSDFFVLFPGHFSEIRIWY
jgi:hypothetical protein